MIKTIKSILKYSIFPVIVFIIAIFQTACEKINIQNIDTQAYYVGKTDENTFIIKFESVTKDKVTGVRYKVENLSVVAENISVKAGYKKLNVYIGKNSSSIKIVPFVITNDSITGEFNLDGKEIQFVINKYSAPFFKEFESQFKDEKYNVEVKKDIIYGKGKGFWTYNPEKNEPFAKSYADKLGELMKYDLSPRDLDLKLDIYLPQNDTCNQRPLLMLIHGGAFFNGDKASEAYTKWSKHFAAMGFVTVSINYRMGFLPSANQIDCAGYRAVQDANAAMRYMIHNAKKYKINTDWIFAGGTSAGAITALNLAFMRDANRPEASKGKLLRKDMGGINAISPEYKETFKIRAVANMWGAVHDINMIENSKTSIISFHGDADKIVPYGYDYPFKNILDPAEKVRKEKKERFSISINELIVNKMYGSSIIHSKAESLGLKNKLYTKHNCGHSLHIDENKNLCSYFYFIQDEVTAFFVEELIPSPVKIVQDKFNPHNFIIEGKNIKQLHWKVDNGIILENDKNHAKIILLPTSSTHKITVSGYYNNGIGFCEEIKI